MFSSLNAFFLSPTLFQVHYFLNQLQSKAICEKSDETKQKDKESSKEKELLQRLKVQVCLHELKKSVQSTIRLYTFFPLVFLGETKKVIVVICHIVSGRRA